MGIPSSMLRTSDWLQALAKANPQIKRHKNARSHYFPSDAFCAGYKANIIVSVDG
jgi:hypothetical protein